MRRSALSETLLLGVFLLASSSIQAEERWIDDHELEARFRKALVAFREDGEYPDGKSIVEQLQEGTYSFDIPSVSKQENPIEGALAATYVVGHIYKCKDCDKWHSNIAGGVAISPEGLLLTNDHVLRFGDGAVFGVMNAKGEVFPIKAVLASSKRDDIALVQIEAPSPIPYASFSEKAEVSEKVFVFSHPDTHLFSYTEGIVSRFYLDTRKKIPRIQITADFARGSSGSGIFNAEGKLVGVAVSTRSVHYDEEEEFPHLQMIVRSGVPLVSIRKLLGIETTAASAKPTEKH